MSMKKKSLTALALAAALVLATHIEPAAAYFTANAAAKGGHTVTVGGTDIEETFSAWTKHVRVVSEEGAQAYYIRARALAGDRYTLEYSGEGWTQGSDGWYYCGAILYGGEQTAELVVKIVNAEEVDAEAFNVVVLYESTPVRYDADGNPYADWQAGGGNWA